MTRGEEKAGRVVVGDVARLAGDQIERRGDFRHRPGQHFPHDFGKTGDLVQTDQRIHLGDFLPQLVVVALGQAAADDDFLPRIFPHAAVMHFEDGVDRFFLGRVDEPAGVDDEHIGLGRFAGDLELPAGGAAEHDLGINKVLRAAEADHADLRAGWSGSCFHAGRRAARAPGIEVIRG